MARPAIEVDCRLEVIGDLIGLRRHTEASRRAITDAIVGLVPSLAEFAGQLDDTNDIGGAIPTQLANEVRLLTP